jgi:predicted transcriptional regulator YheO
MSNRPTINKKTQAGSDALVAKPLRKKAILNLVKISAKEIDASRPSVYKYLLP